MVPHGFKIRCLNTVISHDINQYPLKVADINVYVVPVISLLVQKYSIMIFLSKVTMNDTAS